MPSISFNTCIGDVIVHNPVYKNGFVVDANNNGLIVTHIQGFDNKYETLDEFFLEVI